MNRARICHIITLGDPMTGAQLNTLACLRETRCGYDVELVMGCDGPLREAAEAVGIPVSIIPFKNALFSPVSDIKAIVGLARHFQTTQPLIVHTHSSKAGTLGRIAAWLAHVPLIVHGWHGPSYHQSQAKPVRFVLRLVERALARLAVFHVSVADTLKADLAADGIAPADRIAVIRSAIELDTAAVEKGVARGAIRTELGIPDDAPVVITVGSLQANKAQHLFVDAARRLLLTTPKARFLIAGPSVPAEPDIARKLQNQIEQAHIADAAKLLGQRDDIPALLAASDIFVLCSWREGLPRSVIEALCSGLPVVATDAGSTRDVVQEGRNGFLVSPGDVRALTDRLGQLLHDVDLRRKMSAEAALFDLSPWSGYARIYLSSCLDL